MLEILGALHGGSRRIGMGEQKPGEPPGQRRLADSGGPADDEGLRQAVGAIGLEQRLLRFVMAKEIKGFARMRRFVEAVGLRRGFQLPGAGSVHIGSIPPS